MSLRILPSANEYFMEHVTDEVRVRRIPVSGEVTAYVAGLLNVVASTDSGRSKRILRDEPATMECERMVHGDLDTEELTGIGDGLLFRLGFRFDFAKREGRVDLYSSLGSAAYRTLAAKHPELADLFSPLGQHFSPLSGVIRELHIRELAATTNTLSLLAAYEKVVQGRGGHYMKVLSDRGFKVLGPTKH